MTYAEPIYEHRALLAGRKAAAAEIRQAFRDGTTNELARSFFVTSRRHLETNILQATKARHTDMQMSDHTVNSFAAGYLDTIMAFAMMRVAQNGNG